MSNRIEYQQGEKLGPYDVVYWKDVPNKSNHRQAEFICPFCGKHFINYIYRIKNGACRSCGCQMGKSLTRSNDFKHGDVVGPYHHIFIKEVPKKWGMRTGQFQCGFCGNKFENSISKVKNGVVKSCGCKSNPYNDITNQKFGKLIALYPVWKENKNKVLSWHCKCDCGNEIDVFQHNLTHGRTTSCGCRTNSLGEEKIENILKQLKLSFQKQKTFQDCINPVTNTRLKFDFYLPEYNLCIEYDGIQHFEEVSLCSDTLKDRQYKDNIKNQYCKNNNIKLIRIPYIDYNKLNKEYLLSLL